MFQKIETMMPKGPEWVSTDITLAKAPHEPQTFYYQDIINCAKFLYSNPSFQEAMNYEAVNIFETKNQERCWIYHEFMTGNIVNKLQVWKFDVLIDEFKVYTYCL